MTTATRALVTGANGLIGANLVRELLAQGIEVAALVRAHSDTSALDGLPVTLHRAALDGDAAAPVEAAMQGCTFVFHAAMHFSYERRQAAALARAATRGTENMLRAARAAGVGRVVVTSSSVVFGYGRSAREPPRDETQGLVDAGGENAYVAAKVRQDRGALAVAAEIGLDLVIVCPTLSIGPYGTTLGPSNGALVAYLDDPTRATYPGGCNVVSTADIAAGHWLAARHGEAGQHYLLGGENLEWRTLHALVAELAGVEPPRFALNHSLAYLGATAEELRARWRARAALATREQAAMMGRWYWYSHTKAERLGYRPRAARQAVAEALSWLAASRHVSRELRATLRLHDEVYAVRAAAARRIAG